MLESEILSIGLVVVVVWLCVRIVLVPEKDPLQVDDIDYADADV